MELALDLNRRYTYADYLTWLDDKRRELIDGFIKLFSPSPARRHQKVATGITSTLYHLIKRHHGRCHVYHAPFDVRLPQNGERDNDKIYTVVQPDICVVCDLSKLDDAGCIGAPDLVVEVQSFSTAKYDTTQKKDLYEAAGVREYWVVDPYDGVEVFLLQPNGKYDDSTRYEKHDQLPVHIFGGEAIDLNEIFE